MKKRVALGSAEARLFGKAGLLVPVLDFSAEAWQKFRWRIEKRPSPLRNPVVVHFASCVASVSAV